jgi:hypothetical protein
MYASTPPIKVPQMKAKCGKIKGRPEKVRRHEISCTKCALKYAKK